MNHLTFADDGFEGLCQGNGGGQGVGEGVVDGTQGVVEHCRGRGRG